MTTFKDFNAFLHQLIDEECELSIKACEEARETIASLTFLVNDHVKKKKDAERNTKKNAFLNKCKKSNSVLSNYNTLIQNNIQFESTE